MPSNATYQISLPQFEGPFDLLLFFIERDELDIYNIPINRITMDFLAYIRQMEDMDIELASDFILFASTLMRLKARMLLPRRELNAQGEEIDPREELVNKILEYKRFKEVAVQMATLEAERLLRQKRGNIRAELAALGNEYSEGTEVQSLTLYKLLQTFEKVIRRMNARNERPQHVVVKYNYSLEGQRAWVMDRLRTHKRNSFEGIFAQVENRIHAIFTFLSILELVQQQYLSLLTGTGRNNFILEWNEERPEEAAAPEPGLTTA